jgi:O-antigen/teichoic acid export membrane protein
MTKLQFKSSSSDPLLSQAGPMIIQYISSSGTMMLGLGAQLATFVLLARYLGTELFGTLMVITAMTQIAMSLCGVGAEEAMVRRLARDPTLYSKLLGHNLLLIFFSGMVLTPVCVAGLYYVVPLAHLTDGKLIVITIFALSNVVLYRCISLTESIFIGRRWYSHANGVVVVFSVVRGLAAVVATVIFGVDQLEHWAVWYGAIHVAGVIGCIAILRQFGPPQWILLREELSRGVHVVVPIFLNNMRQNVEPLILNAVVSPGIVGTYSAASRITQTGLVTVWPFNRILYPMLAIAGGKNFHASFKLAIRMLFVTAGLGVATSVALFFLAPYVMLFFGKGYSDSAVYLQILCWLIPLYAIHSVAYDVLGATEHHGIRALIFNSASFIAVGLVLILTYLFQITGTFIALYVGQSLILIGLWAVMFYLNWRSRSPA